MRSTHVVIMVVYAALLILSTVTTAEETGVFGDQWIHSTVILATREEMAGEMCTHQGTRCAAITVTTARNKVTASTVEVRLHVNFGFYH